MEKKNDEGVVVDQTEETQSINLLPDPCWSLVAMKQL